MDSSVIIIVLSLLFSAFFSGMEIAFVSANKIHIEIEKKQEGFLAKVLTLLTDKPSKFIATMLIGNNIALVIYGLFMGDMLMEWFQSLLPSNIQLVNLLLTDFSLLSQTIISTLVIFTDGRVFAKSIFPDIRQCADQGVRGAGLFLLFAVLHHFVVCDQGIRLYIKDILQNRRG